MREAQLEGFLRRLSYDEYEAVVSAHEAGLARADAETAAAMAPPAADPVDEVPGFRGGRFSRDELVELIRGHTGDDNPTMNRPTLREIEAALDNANPEPLTGQNAEAFFDGNVRVIVNYDWPERSTANYIREQD